MLLIPPGYSPVACIASSATGREKPPIAAMQSKIRIYRRDVFKGLAANLYLVVALVRPAAWTEVTTSTMGMAEIRWHIRRALTAIFVDELRPRDDRPQISVALP